MNDSRAVLLDWDGVVSDSLPLYIEFYREVCRRYSRPLPVETVEEFRDWYEPRWERNFYETGFSEQDFRDILKLGETLLDYSRVPLFANIPEMLRRLASEWPVAIVSTCPTPMIRKRLAQEGLEGLFARIVGSDDGSTEKASRVTRTLESLRAEEGVMVGDTPLDIEAGHANGLGTIGVTYGWATARRVEAAGPCALVHRPADLEGTIREVLGSRCRDRS
ncbi:MAG: HAD family hydrolase [Armatimonadetes bacterium]|nr:HAD family hydrolase [Armatimonadota bacterium]